MSDRMKTKCATSTLLRTARFLCAIYVASMQATGIASALLGQAHPTLIIPAYYTSAGNENFCNDQSFFLGSNSVVVKFPKEAIGSLAAFYVLSRNTDLITFLPGKIDTPFEDVTNQAGQLLPPCQKMNLRRYTLNGTKGQQYIVIGKEGLVTEAGDKPEDYITFGSLVIPHQAKAKHGDFIQRQEDPIALPTHTPDPMGVAPYQDAIADHKDITSTVSQLGDDMIKKYNGCKETDRCLNQEIRKGMQATYVMSTPVKISCTQDDSVVNDLACSSTPLIALRNYRRIPFFAWCISKATKKASSLSSQ